MLQWKVIHSMIMFYTKMQSQILFSCIEALFSGDRVGLTDMASELFIWPDMSHKILDSNFTYLYEYITQ